VGIVSMRVYACWVGCYCFDHLSIGRKSTGAAWLPDCYVDYLCSYEN